MNRTPRFRWYFGNAIRELGQTLDRLGSRFQGSYAFKEKLSRHRRTMNIGSFFPIIDESVRIGANSTVGGAVQLGINSRVWFGSTLRGDVQKITVGKNTDIGNRVVIHTASGFHPVFLKTKKSSIPTIIGDDVLVCDGVTLHACKLENNTAIGPGAIVLDGAVVKSGAIVGSGSIVTMGSVVKSDQYWEGSPAVYVKDVTEQEKLLVKKKLEEQEKLAEQVLRTA